MIDDVQGDDPFAEQARDLVEKDGNVVGPTLVDRRAIRGPDEQAVVPEVSAELRAADRIFPEQEDVVQLDVLEFVPAIDQTPR